MKRRFALAIASVAAALVVAGPAHAVGGNYVIKGGTPKQHANVRAALDASSFDWGVVPAKIEIRIVRAPKTFAYRGHIVLDGRLVDSGRYAWAFIQHEYAHQVDFFLLGPRTRAQLNRQLGSTRWSAQAKMPSRHDHELGCEKFASTLTWAFWQSKDNALRPKSASDESAAMSPAQFRRLLGGLVRAPRLAAR